MRIPAPGSEDAVRPSSSAGRTLLPCSQAQERFWYEEQLQPGTSARNVFARWRLEGDVSTTILTEAWQAVIRHHAMLRASFVNVDGVPMQTFASDVDFVVRELDLTLLSRAAAEDEADRIASVEAHTAFDLTDAPLLRVVHVRLHERVSILMITAHHLVADGWSFGILARDMGQAYAAIVERRPIALGVCRTSYAEHSATENAWLATNPLGEELATLQTRLAGLKRFELVPDHPRPEMQSANGEIESVLLDRTLTDALSALSKVRHCTLFMTAYAALLVLLHRHSGESDVSMSTQVAGRDRVELENVVGTFVNTIPLRNTIDPGFTFDELLLDVRDTVTDAFEARHVPMGMLADIVKPKRDLSRLSLFPTNFIFQRSFIDNASYGKFKLVDLPSRSAGSLYDLCFFMVERPEGWRVSCEFNTDLFERRTISGLLARFVMLLQGVLSAPGARIADLPLLTDSDRAELARLRSPALGAPAGATVLDLLAEQAARTPNAVAVACGGASLTYAALDLRSTQLARELHGSLGTGTRIGVLLDRSIEAVVAMLAVLKSGNAYVMLDPLLERTAEVIAVAQLAAIVTRSTLNGGPGTGGIPRILVDGPPAANASRATPLPAASPGDVAYVAFTFPVGRAPRGVQIGHRALLNVVGAVRERPGVSASDTLLAVTTFANDIVSVDVFLPLATGAKLVIAKDREIHDGAALNALARSTAATIVQATPETWQRLVDAGWSGNRGWRAICCGAPLDRELAEALLERVEALWITYGFPETTAYCAFLSLERAAQAQRIGAPIPNVELHLLDAAGHALPPGALGDLYVGGACLANDYLGEESASDAFVDDLPVSPGTRLFRTGDRGRMRSDGHIDVLVRTAPRAPIDDQRAGAASPPDLAHAASVQTLSHEKTEHVMHAIVAELLGHDRFGREDDIFALGLHSLLAMRLIARIKKAYGVELPLRTLIEYPTVASLAQRIDLLQDALHLLGVPEPIELVNATGTKPPLFFFHGDVTADGLYSHRVASMMGADQPIYLVSPHGTAGLPLYASTEEMARDYYDRIRAVQPSGPYRVGGLCLGGLVAFEIARMLRAQGEIVDRVVLVNTGASPHRPLRWLDGMIRRVALDPSRPRRSREKLCYNLAWLGALLVANPVQLVQTIAERLHKMRRREPVWQGEAPAATDRDAQIALAYLDAAAFTYHAQPYDGDVTLIWAVDQATHVKAAEREWRQVVRNVRVLLIEGGHAPIYTNLEGFSQALTSALHG